MIVCSCNRLTDRDIRACAKRFVGGPVRVLDIYGMLGCAPQCGKCAPTLAAIAREAAKTSCDCGPDNCKCAAQAAHAA